MTLSLHVNHDSFSTGQSRRDAPDESKGRPRKASQHRSAENGLDINRIAPTAFLLSNIPIQQHTNCRRRNMHATRSDRSPDTTPQLLARGAENGQPSEARHVRRRMHQEETDSPNLYGTSAEQNLRHPEYPKQRNRFRTLHIHGGSNGDSVRETPGEEAPSRAICRTEDRLPFC